MGQMVMAVLAEQPNYGPLYARWPEPGLGIRGARP